MSLTLTGLQAAFLNELDAGTFQEHIAEGMVPSLVNTQAVPTKGEHPLHSWTSSLDFDSIDVTDGFTNSTGTNGNGVSAFDDFRSTATLNQKNIVAGINYAQGAINPFSLFGTSQGIGVDSLNNPSQNFLSGFSENVAAQAGFAAAQKFYHGFGTGTPTNGLIDIASATTSTLSTAQSVGTGTGAWSASNVVSRLASFINARPSSVLNRTDAIVIVPMVVYNFYRQAIRTANYNDPQFQNTATGAGLLSSAWLDDPRVTIIGDPAYQASVGTDFTAANAIVRLIHADDTYSATTTLSELEDVSFEYDGIRKLIYFSIPIFGGVQVGDARGMLVSSNT